MNHIFRAGVRVATIAALLIAITSLVPAISRAQTVAPDGAVDENALWEQGKTKEWWIEDQRIGEYYVEKGIGMENPDLISYGLNILNWGFNHEAADGSFPGTAGGTVGAMFHSESLFAEDVARATILLKSYHPVTYTLAPGTYSSIITSYAADLHAIAGWMLSAKVLPFGEAYDANFTHRHWIVASMLGQIGALTGDSSLAPAAASWAQVGLQMQLPHGWLAALVRSANNTVPPATLVTPGTHVPAIAYDVISAEGVDPELGGYDASYQVIGILMAEHYYPYAPRSLQTAIRKMIAAALEWENKRIATNGHVALTGSTRVGIEVNHDGQVKTMAVSSAIDAENGAVSILGDDYYTVFAARLLAGGVPVTSDVVAVDGAVDSNTALDSNPGANWSIADQTVGANYVDAGIQREDDALIRQGLHVLDWGWAHQASNGGFASSTSAFYGASQFIEAAARAVREIESYNPVTYAADAVFYKAVVSRYTARLHGAALWLTSPTIAAAGWRGDSAWTNRRYLVADALQEVSLLTGDATLAAEALPYLQDALSRQWTDGINPVNGGGDINYQAEGIYYAAEYSTLTSNEPLQANLIGMMELGLNWQMQWISPHGDIGAIANPYYKSIEEAFDAAYEVTHVPSYQVMANRIAGRY